MPRQLPDWLKIQPRLGKNYREIKKIINHNRLHTICTSALCPNIYECFEQRTATFLLMGDCCTRTCTFCNVAHGKPDPLDPDEPQRVASAIRKIGLEYAVITSVTRDDIPDGGASHFAATIRAIKQRAPGCLIEVLIPDFRGSREALEEIISAGPGVINHNVETVPRLYPEIRPEANYERSLGLLQQIYKKAPAILTKSGLMIGLGEKEEEIKEVMKELRRVNCRLLTIGQYLRPSRKHYPVRRYYTPEFYSALESHALSIGFLQCVARPLVRSSYRAHQSVASLRPGQMPEGGDP